jgi:hypothetical protein
MSAPKRTLVHAEEELRCVIANERRTLRALRKSEATVKRLTEALEDCCDRMERARGVLCPDGPTPTCNWGMLDTSIARAALAEGREKEGKNGK